MSDHPRTDALIERQEGESFRLQWVVKGSPQALISHVVRHFEELTEHAETLERELAREKKEGDTLLEESLAVERENAALRRALAEITPAMPPENALCHVGICPQSRCGNCSRIARAHAALAEKPADPLRKGDELDALADQAKDALDSMGFKSEHGIWVRGVDYDELVAAARAVAPFLTAKVPIDYIRDGEAWNARARFLSLVNSPHHKEPSNG